MSSGWSCCCCCWWWSSLANRTTTVLILLPFPSFLFLSPVVLLLFLPSSLKHSKGLLGGGEVEMGGEEEKEGEGVAETYGRARGSEGEERAMETGEEHEKKEEGGREGVGEEEEERRVGEGF